MVVAIFDVDIKSLSRVKRSLAKLGCTKSPHGAKAYNFYLILGFPTVLRTDRKVSVNDTNNNHNYYHNPYPNTYPDPKPDSYP